MMRITLLDQTKDQINSNQPYTSYTVSSKKSGDKNGLPQSPIKKTNHFLNQFIMKKIFYTLFMCLLTYNIQAQTWSAITPPAGGNFFVDIDFVDANNGALARGAGGDVSYTTDGGASWITSPSFGSDMYSVDMLDPSTIFTIGAGSSGSKTTDGVTWSAIANTGAGHAHGGIRMVDANTGWVFTLNGRLYKTTNGATSWTLVNSFGNIGHFVKGKVNSSTNAFWPTGINNSIIRTIDGTNWTTVHTAAANVLCIDCINNNECWAGLINGTIVKTTNASAATPTWTTHSTGSSFRINGISFISATEGWVAGAGGVIRYTNDGGTTWVNQASGTTQFLWDVSMVNSTVGYVSGNGNTLLKFDAPAVGTALDFDGTDDYVNLGNINMISTGTIGHYTVELWAKLDAYNPGYSSMCGDEIGSNRGILFEISPTGFVTTFHPSTGRRSSTNLQVPLNTWTHITLTQDATGVHSYINGVFDATLLTNATPHLESATGTYVGRFPSGSRNLNGQLDELRLWNYARCTAELIGSKDCELIGNEPGLIAYYNFNQGIEAGANPAETILLDRQTNIAPNNGTLNAFALNGAGSNWIDGTTNGVSGTCTGAIAEIAITGLGNVITDGDLVPATTDDTDYGSIAVSNNDVHTFTIDNSAGGGVLNVSTINIGGTNAVDFVVGGITLPAVIAAGNTTTFTLTFTPASVGLRSATVTVNNDDCDEAIYNFAVQGTGLALGDLAITEWISNPSGIETTDEWVEVYNFGSVAIDIQNWRIKDEDTDNDIITTSSFVIPVGGYAILANNKAAFEAQWFKGCTQANVLEVTGLALDNDSDEIMIEDAGGNIIWSLAYQNDETEGRATHYTEAPTFTNRIWGSKGSTGVNRSGNDPATASLGYESNNITADPLAVPSTTGDTGSPLNNTVTTTDIVRDEALDFDGVDDHVTMPSTASLESYVTTGALTVEMWVYPTSIAGRPTLISNRNGANTQGFVFEHFSGQLHTFVRFGGGWVEAPINFNMNEWQHIAVVAEENVGIRTYVNGILTNSTSATGAFSPSGGILNIGGDTRTSSFLFTGGMDEVRIWNTARTEQEIRESMHLTLDGCENGLAAYYQMNDGIGSSVLTDKTGNGNDGTLTNMDPATDWITSGVNVGNDASSNSNSQTITAVPAGTSTQNFATANLEMKFFVHSGVENYTVTYQAFTPNATAGADGVNIIQNPMWTVNKSTSTETQLVDYTFTFPAATFTNLDPTKYSLYWRTMSADGDWTKISTAHSVTATTVGFGKISLTGQFMVVQESDNLVSDVRGNMYTFDGTDDYINMGDLSQLDMGTNDLTLEAWIKTIGTGGNQSIISKRFGSSGNGYNIRVRNSGVANVESLDNNSASFINGTTIVTDGQWHHIAATFDRSGNLSLYVDGILEGTTDMTSESGDLSNDQPFTIGRKFIAPNILFLGNIDEVRVWNAVRTQAEIRKNMHLTLKGNETGLVSYYQFNNDDAVGIANGVKDAVGGNHGTTQNMTAADYIPSEVAVAGGVSDRITIAAAGVVNLPNSGVDINFGATHPNGEIVVYRLETEKPHGWNSIGADVDNEYFVVKNFGANQTFSALNDITFNRLSYVSPADIGQPQATTPLQLYKRGDNDFGATWGTSFGGADNASAGSNGMISFNATNNLTSFSQIVLVNAGPNSDLPVELLNFDVERLDADHVELVWSTATETNNQGFYIERMLELEGEFEAIAFVDGQGTTVITTDYYSKDANSYTGVTYYRLKQVDFDGTTTYSKIKAVSGTNNQNTSYIDVSVYPNPVYDVLKVRFNELPKDTDFAKVKIMSTNGQIVHDFTAGIQSYQVLEIEEVKQLTPALYILSIEMNGTEKIIQKFIKQ